jgi:DNA polymerase IV (DinB-like DNA polymerase)
MQMPPSRIIFHIDMDSFFSSVEVRERPSFKGLPVVVGSDPKKGEGRGVVSTCSYEARNYGIHSAMPISKAYMLCPDAVFLRVNMPLYKQASENIMLLLQRYTSVFQQVSVDEAYLDVTDIVKTYTEAQDLALRIKKEMYDDEDLTCSIGIAPNKTVAKIASDYQKPDGLTVVKPENVQEFMFPLEVSAIPGVGRRTREILEKMGIRTIGDLARTDVQLLVSRLGKSSLKLRQMALGNYHSKVAGKSEVKSISKEDTFEEDVGDMELLRETMDMLAQQVHSRLVRHGYVFRTVNLKIRFEDFTTYTRAFSLRATSNDLSVICKIGTRMLQEFSCKKKVRLIGIGVSSLMKIDSQQTTLEDFIRGDQNENGNLIRPSR